jgi:uncharacterized membrane protein YdcZ (DUF606 family)
MSWLERRLSGACGPDYPLGEVVGGLGSAMYITAGILLFPRLGAIVAVALPRIPWWGWLGGMCGAVYVTLVFLLIPELGAAPVVALTVAGQQVASSSSTATAFSVCRGAKSRAGASRESPCFSSGSR